MKIKNLSRFLLVVFLLATGITPVTAHEAGHCGSVEPIRPGDSVTDAVSDVPAAHIDLTEVETSLSGERLTVVFHLEDLPETLTFNRTEHGEGSKEYEWEVAIDVDNDRSTGPGGFDTLLTAYHIAFLSHEGTEADTIAPIGEMLEAAVWETHAGGSTSNSRRRRLGGVFRRRHDNDHRQHSRNHKRIATDVFQLMMSSSPARLIRWTAMLHTG